MRFCNCIHKVSKNIPIVQYCCIILMLFYARRFYKSVCYNYVEINVGQKKNEYSSNYTHSLHYKLMYNLLLLYVGFFETIAFATVFDFQVNTYYQCQYTE